MFACYAKYNNKWTLIFNNNIFSMFVCYAKYNNKWTFYPPHPYRERRLLVMLNIVVNMRWLISFFLNGNKKGTQMKKCIYRIKK